MARVNRDGVMMDDGAPHLGGNRPGGDPLCMCPDVWSYLAWRYKIKSVFDVGCGTGETMRYFQQLGCDTVGIDGMQANVDQCPPIAKVFDICGPEKWSTFDVFDLVWCCEVVEHIDEAHVDVLLDLLTSGLHLAMTHAVPGQPGYHHVNCQPAEYWIEKIEARGMRFDFETTKFVQSLILDNENYFKKTGLIFHA